MQNTPLTRKATRARVGPWYVLQARNPSSPGMKYGTLLNAIHKGRVTARSVIRGPTTHQLWRFAARVKGISRHFGVCYYCGGSVAAASALCPKCKRSQDVPANPDVLLEVEAPLPAPTPMPRKVSPATEAVAIEPVVVEPVMDKPAPANVEIAVAPAAPAIELVPEVIKPEAVEPEPMLASPVQETASNPESVDVMESDSEPFEPETDPEPQENSEPAPPPTVLPGFSRESEREAREAEDLRERTLPLAPETALVEHSELEQPLERNLPARNLPVRELTAQDLAAAFSLRYDPRTDRPLPPARTKMQVAVLTALVFLCVVGVAASVLVPQVHDWVMAGWHQVFPPARSGTNPAMLPAIPMPVNSATTAPSEPGSEVVYGGDASPAPINGLQNISASPTTREDPVAQANDWRSKGMDAETRGDYSAAEYDYEQVEKLPVANWPADIEDKLANARKMFENQVREK
jgi:hypothetical protein